MTSLLEQVKWITLGIWENYPWCCIATFIRESEDGEYSYANRLYDRQCAEGKTPTWSGTGYVPCERCAQRWLI